jgi:hypothetical protein
MYQDTAGIFRKTSRSFFLDTLSSTIPIPHFRMTLDIPLNFVTVVVAAAVSFALGFLWYGPLFGKTWMHLSGISKQQMEKAKNKNMTGIFALSAFGSFVMAFVLMHSLTFASTYLHLSGFNAGLQVAFWNWIGFIAPVTMGSVLWEGKSWKLWILNNGFWLISLSVMGGILAVWK